MAGTDKVSSFIREQSPPRFGHSFRLQPFLSGDTMKWDVGAYIPCYNAEQYLVGSLEALAQQSCPPAEIVVVDDGSSDRSAEIARSFPVRLLRHPTNRGLGAARNTALRDTRHEFIAAVDADVVAESDWLERLLKALGKDESAAGAGGRLVERFQDTPADHWRALHMPQDRGGARLVMKGPGYIRGYLSGFGTVFRKDALEHVGGYNEMYRTNYEDADIGQRLLRAGYTLLYEPEAIAYHMRRDTPYSIVRTAWRWDFWPQYYRGNYKAVGRKLLQNLRWESELVGQHLRMRAFPLLPIDCLYFALYCYWDLRYHLSLAVGKAREAIGAMGRSNGQRRRF